MKLSVIIPVYNEVKTINEIIKKVLEVNVEYKEIIIVDDHSNDGTNKIIEKFKENNLIKIIRHEKNMGKGAAIITAIPLLTGDYVIIQDADLEYDPEDYVKFMNLININKDIKVLYGSRVLGRKKMEKKFAVVFRIFANFILTKLSNFLNRQKLTDAHTCYKLFKSDLFKSIKLEESDFSFCPEITTKISLLKIDIFEIPINYNGRTYDQGKKIVASDGLKAIWTLIKYRFF